MFKREAVVMLLVLAGPMLLSLVTTALALVAIGCP